MELPRCATQFGQAWAGMFGGPAGSADSAGSRRPTGGVVPSFVLSGFVVPGSVLSAVVAPGCVVKERRLHAG